MYAIIRTGTYNENFMRSVINAPDVNTPRTWGYHVNNPERSVIQKHIYDIEEKSGYVFFMRPKKSGGGICGRCKIANVRVVEPSPEINERYKWTSTSNISKNQWNVIFDVLEYTDLTNRADCKDDVVRRIKKFSQSSVFRIIDHNSEIFQLCEVLSL